MILNPKPLKPGSKIAIAAPAGRIYPKDLEFAVQWIQSHNWQAIYSEEIFRHFDFGYAYAGTDQHRTNQLQRYLDDNSIKAIWFARGGYGSAKIIDALNFEQFIQDPKWLIGYSDITVFHNHLNNLGVPTLHAVTAKQLNITYTQATYSNLVKVLKGETLSYSIPTHPYNIHGAINGILMGGNLSIIYSLLGSKSFMNGENIILFIEDWQENWYHLDRMLTALKRSNLFQRLKGIIVGSFTQMDIRKDNPNYHMYYDETSNDIIYAFVKELKIPVAFQFPAGHTGDNQALIMGKEVTLKVNENDVTLCWVS